MTDETLQQVIVEGLRTNPRVAEFDWLGGEPLLAGLAFYRRVVELQTKHATLGQRIINRVQTNGTLMTDEWAKFLAVNNFTVGVSLDGPPSLNDSFRYDDRGQGTTSHVLKALELLRQHGIYHGVICVVNSLNVQYPAEVLNFFVENGINRLAFNHAKGLTPEGQPLPTTVSPDAYAEFMCRLFDLWMERDDPNLVIRQFKSILHSLLGGRYRMCVLSNQCHTLFGIEPDGEVYPCEDHPGEGWPSFGNIRNGMEAVMNHHHRQQFINKIGEAKQACTTCRWWNLCQGGCPRDYYFGNEQATHHNRMCAAHRRIFSHIFQRTSTYLPSMKFPES